MRERLQQAVELIDALSLRERALLMLAVLAVLVGLWEVLFFGPLQQRQQAVREQVETLHNSVAALNRSITEAADKRAEDPNATLHTQLSAIREENRRLDEKLHAMTAGLVAPREMATVLERVLKAQQGLRLISIANLPAETVSLGAGADPDAAQVFRHGLTLTFEGGYLDTLRYLQALSRLPWHFFWDGLELEVSKYPISRVTVTVYTLNLKEGWIGV